MKERIFHFYCEAFVVLLLFIFPPSSARSVSFFLYIFVCRLKMNENKFNLTAALTKKSLPFLLLLPFFHEIKYFFLLKIYERRAAEAFNGACLTSVSYHEYSIFAVSLY